MGLTYRSKEGKDYETAGIERQSDGDGNDPRYEDAIEHRRQHEPILPERLGKTKTRPRICDHEFREALLRGAEPRRNIDISPLPWPHPVSDYTG